MGTIISNTANIVILRVTIVILRLSSSLSHDGLLWAMRSPLFGA